MDEQEQLARLVGGGEGFDSSTSGDMIAESLKNLLGGIDPAVYSKVQEENANNPELENIRQVKVSQPLKKAPIVDFNAERILTDIYSAYDNSIEIFEKIGLENEISEKLVENIWILESCIKGLGGKIEHFIPEDFLSGLGSPDTHVNALKVIETTKKYYNLGKISDDNVDKSGKSITIRFNGVSASNIQYSAKGEILAKNGWIGNEAIDYIYNANGGKMTVKAFVGNKWVAQKDYDVRWELEEQEIIDESQNVDEVVNEDKINHDPSDLTNENSAYFEKLFNDPSRVKSEDVNAPSDELL